MQLFHFTSARHLRPISKHGLTVGDVPTDIYRQRGKIGVWLTSNGTNKGHGLSASKERYRLSINIPDSDRALVKWDRWFPGNVTDRTAHFLHSTAENFESWYIYFGFIPAELITDVHDMSLDQPVEDWANVQQSAEHDVVAVPPTRFAVRRWQKRMLKGVQRYLRRNQ